MIAGGLRQGLLAQVMLEVAHDLVNVALGSLMRMGDVVALGQVVDDLLIGQDLILVPVDQAGFLAAVDMHVERLTLLDAFVDSKWS